MSVDIGRLIVVGVDRNIVTLEVDHSGRITSCVPFDKVKNRPDRLDGSVALDNDDIQQTVVGFGHVGKAHLSGRASVEDEKDQRRSVVTFVGGLDGDVHLSFGMTTHKEEQKIIDFFKAKNRAKDLVIYACTSGYPVPFEDICLREITRLKETYGNDVKAIGFSGHHLGIAVDIAALALGATYFERHFTLDRTWKGTDHAASLEPQGLQKLARDLRQTYLALQYKPKEILDIEEVQRKKLKRLLERV